MNLNLSNMYYLIGLYVFSYLAIMTIKAQSSAKIILTELCMEERERETANLIGPGQSSIYQDGLTGDVGVGLGTEERGQPAIFVYRAVASQGEGL